MPNNVTVTFGGAAAESGNIRTVLVDLDNAEKGTPGYELLNNPPANTRIVLSNGNVYTTNGAGIVDEVLFKPVLESGTRDSRQTAVGNLGLDTDVGGAYSGMLAGWYLRSGQPFSSRRQL